MLGPIPISQREGTPEQRKAAYEADMKVLREEPFRYGGEFSGAIPGQQVVLTGVQAVNEKGEVLTIAPKPVMADSAKVVAKEQKSDKVKPTEGK